MKILLINPAGGRVENLDARATAPPLGLLYIASNLIKHSHEIKLIDQSGSFINDNELVQAANSFDPELVCFSVMGSQSISAGRITDQLKKILPNAKILWGGVNPTFNAVRILKKYLNVDFCIKGEGEESVIELIKVLNTKTFNKVHGLVYRVRNTIIKEGPPRILIENLDSLPFPDRSLVKDIMYGSISGLQVKHFTSIISSRGCPHTCRYCCCNALVNRRWRARSVDNVLDELELIENQGYKLVLFFDDGLLLNNKRIIKLSQGIRKRGIKLDWFFESRVDNANRDIFREMVKAGAKAAYFGAESANERVLEWYDKQITPHQTKLAVKNARNAGIDFITASFILGCPSETKQEIENTINFMTKLDVDFVQVSRLIAYPGTFLWDDLVKKGYLDPDKYWETGVYVGTIHPKSLPNDYLKAKVEEAYVRFLGNWKLKTCHIWRLLRSRFRQNVLFNNLNYFRKDLAHNLIHEKE